jgi:hypothetical protein
VGAWMVGKTMSLKDDHVLSLKPVKMEKGIRSHMELKLLIG